MLAPQGYPAPDVHPLQSSVCATVNEPTITTIDNNANQIFICTIHSFDSHFIHALPFRHYLHFVLFVFSIQ